MSAVIESKGGQEETVVQKATDGQETTNSQEAKIETEESFSDLTPLRDTIFKALGKKNSLKALQYVFGAEKDTLKFALSFSIQRNKIPEVEYLLSKGWPIDAILIEYPRFTALMKACFSASPEMVKFLLDKGAKLDNKEANASYTPFLCAVDNNNRKVMDYLESLDPKIFEKTASDGTSAFIIAAQQENVELMQYILKKDKDALKRNLIWDRKVTKNGTPLMQAARNGRIKAMTFILEVDPDALRNYIHGWTPLMAAAEGFEKRPAIEFILSKNPALLNAVDNQGFNALHIAAWSGDLETIKYLLSRGARVNCVSNAGQTPLTLAEDRDHREVEEYLSGAANLIEHVKKGHLKEVMDWSQKSEDYLFRDNTGESLLYIALQHGQEEVALYLLSFQKKLYLNDKGETAFQSFVKKYGIKNLISLLSKRLKSLADSGKPPMLIAAQIAAGHQEFEDLIRYAEQNKVKLDYEELAIHFDKKYWVTFAKELADCKESKETVDEVAAKKEKLSHLIESNIVICRESKEKENELEFLPGKDADESGALVESEEERYRRLSYAFKFALEARDFNSASRIYLAMLEDGATLPDITQVSEATSKGIKTKDDFFLKLMQTHYKLKHKIPLALEEPSELESPSVATEKFDPNTLQG